MSPEDEIRVAKLAALASAAGIASASDAAKTIEAATRIFADLSSDRAQRGAA